MTNNIQELAHTCQSDISTHHSSDILSVFHGKTEPRTLCGFHAMREGFTDTPTAKSRTEVERFSEYRNKYTDELVRIYGGVMRDRALYCYAMDTQSYRFTIGLEGRDGTTFETRNWVRVS